MKEIKQRTVVKDIKRLNRNPRLMDRARKSIARFNRQTDDDKKPSQSPVEYAQHRSIGAAKKMMRAQIGMSVYVNNRLIRRIQKKLILPDTEMAMQQGVGNIQTEPSVTPNTRLTRRLSLRKPADGRYLLSSGSYLGKHRFIQSRVRARLLRSRTDSFPSQMNRDDGHSQPAGKKESFSASVPRYTSGRMNRHNRQSPEGMERRHFRKPFSRIPSVISKKTGYSIKRRERNFKKLTPIIKMGQHFGQGKNRSDAQTEGKANAIKEIQRAVQMAVSTRRSIQTAKAAARLNLFIIRMVVRAAALLVKGLTAVMGVGGSIIAILCIVMAIASVISSPFGIFMSGENTDADVKPLSRIVQEMDDEFAARLVEIQKSAGNVDRVEFHYLGSADNTRIDNWEDIIAVFAVKTVMDEKNGMDVVTLDATRIGIIRSVFWDMNPIESSVETIEHKESITVEHEDGSTSEETTTRYERILHITIASQTAEQQADQYKFTNEQRELMKEMLSTEFRPLMFAILGKDLDYGLTPDQLDIVQNHLPEGTRGSDAVKLALTRLGDPYSQPKAGQDHYTDCSYLVQWVYRQLGINLPRTAAEQAKFCVENGLIVSAADLVPGDLVFWSYEQNGRFMDITHVGIYAGDGKVVDASSSRGQVVYRNLFDSDKRVLYGRPHHSNQFPDLRD
ncbi:C40 family peptidase [Paenibacillus chartarius]|uniref:C40 family peptidase n=1 Tax=Paenibacillus chartarius TaxID=747481 RepID=A0ABV6DJS0_9BACL